MNATLIDGVSALVLIVFVFVGYRRGFAAMLLGLVGWLVAALGANLLSKPLSMWIYATFLRGGLAAAVQKQVTAYAGPAQLVADLSGLLDALPTWLSNAVEVEGVGLETWLSGLSAEAGLTAVADRFLENVVSPLATALLQMVLFFVLLSLFMMAVQVFSSILRHVNDIPVVGTLNAVLGAVAGAVQGGLALLLCAAVLHFAILLSGDQLGFIEQSSIQKTYVFRPFYSTGVDLTSSIRK